MCHKAFFCTRSDYFKAMLSDHFDENRGNEQVSVIRLNDVSVDVFVCILYYIYTGSCQVIADIYHQQSEISVSL